MADKELKAFNAGKAMVIGFIEGLKERGANYNPRIMEITKP